MNSKLDELANIKPFPRLTWDLNNEPTHLPQDDYQLANSGIFEELLVWEEKDAPYRKRLLKDKTCKT